MPYPLIDKVKEELDRMVAENVIFAVDQPTEWCAPMVVVPKGTNSEKVRICVDYTGLNKVVRRQVHPVANVDDSLAKLGTGELHQVRRKFRVLANPSFGAVETAHDVSHAARPLCVQSFTVRSIF